MLGERRGFYVERAITETQDETGLDRTVQGCLEEITVRQHAVGGASQNEITVQTPFAVPHGDRVRSARERGSNPEARKEKAGRESWPAAKDRSGGRESGAGTHVNSVGTAYSGREGEPPKGYQRTAPR
jgi:hypothetical protein